MGALFLKLVFLFMSVTILEAKTHVRIINDFPDHSVLSVHCRSKNNDLGWHYLSYNSSYEFRFRPNLWGTTLFACEMKWPPSNSHGVVIYRFKRDYDCHFTGGTCTWYIKPTGPCMFMKDYPMMCLGWDQPPNYRMEMQNGN